MLEDKRTPVSVKVKLLDMLLQHALPSQSKGQSLGDVIGDAVKQGHSAVVALKPRREAESELPMVAYGEEGDRGVAPRFTPFHGLSQRAHQLANATKGDA